jgi:hypothetical protein
MAATCGTQQEDTGYLQGGAEVAPNASRRMMNSEVVHMEGQGNRCAQGVTKYRRRLRGAGGGESRTCWGIVNGAYAW